MTIQPCAKCGSLDRNPSGKCRACQKSRSAKWQIDNQEKTRERRAIYYLENKDKANATSALWAKENPEKSKSIKADWYISNKKLLQVRSAIWRVKNFDSVKIRLAAWVKDNQEKSNTYKSAWAKRNAAKVRSKNKSHRQANRGLYKSYSQNRRARKLASGGVLSRGLAEKLFRLQKGKCPCCALPLGDDYHMDHKMPLALGGSNTDYNIQLLRATCNQKKSSKHPGDFMRSRGFLI